MLAVRIVLIVALGLECLASVWFGLHLEYEKILSFRVLFSNSILIMSNSFSFVSLPDNASAPIFMLNAFPFPRNQKPKQTL